MEASPSTKTTASTSFSRIEWFSLFSTLLLLAISAKRIKTYVTAQDPFWYIGLARQILHGQSGSENLAHGLFFVSPGFPLLLAGCIKIFGLYAPYWLNAILAVGFFVLYAAFVRRLFPSYISVSIFVPGTFLLLVSGYMLNIHFLLYPFRGMPIYFLSMLGFYMLVAKAGPKNHGGIYVMSSIPFAVAVAIREPAVFMFGGAACWILWNGGFKKRQTWYHFFCFLSPLFVGAMAIIIVGWSHGRPLNNQLESWLQILSSKPSGQLGSEVLHTAREMTRYWVDALHVPGVVLFVLGLWRCRHISAAICFFVLPSVALFIFYSLYIPHYRYFLSILVLLSPIVCAGLLYLVERFVTPRLNQSNVAWSILPWVMATLLLAGSTMVVKDLEPWGRKVSRDQVEGFRLALSEVAPSGGVAYLDEACRYLTDALICFSELTLGDPAKVQLELDAGKACFYFDPLDEACYYERFLDGTLNPTGMQVKNILMFNADLHLLEETNGSPKVVSIANGHFSVYQIKPRIHNIVREEFRIEASKQVVMWLDFGDQQEGITAEIKLLNAEGEVLETWDDVDARGLQAVVVPGSVIGQGRRELEITSTRPLPAKLLTKFQVHERPVTFSLDTNRHLSTHSWFQPPFHPPHIRHKRIGVFENTGSLRLPMPYGEDFSKVEIAFSFILNRNATRPQILRVTGPDGTMEKIKIIPGKPRTYVSLFAPKSTPKEALLIHFDIEGNMDVLPMRIEQIWVRVH